MDFLRRSTAAVAVLTSLAIMPLAYAQDDALRSKSDQSGTNPINFTYDARIYNEYQWLNVPGPGEAGRNVTTFEYRQPFADGKWQFRTRLRAIDLDIDAAGIDQFGFGDMDMRFLTVPYLNPEKLEAAAIGLEVFIPTGSNDVLSSNALSFGPQVFWAWFNVFGYLDMVAPGYQHQFSVWKESGAPNIHQSNLDLFILKTFNNKQQWILVNPQGVIDYVNDVEAFNIDVEFGSMLEDITGIPGDSFWVRPAVGIGGERFFDASIEAGYKVVW